MSSSKSSPSKKAASTVRKSPRSRTPSDKAVIAAANAPSPSPAKEAHLSPAWSVAAVTSASTTPRSAATFAANSSSSSFVYRRTGTGASARAYASVDNSSTSASWSSGSVTGWDAWLCDNASKRKGELFMLKYSVCWVLFVMWIVWSRVFEKFDGTAYMAVGFICALPAVFWPLLFVDEEERKIPVLQRWTSKANIWIWIMSFNANYFWTHYFYQVLGAKYTFPAPRLNDVPINLYFMTHAYFCLYHTLSNYALRRLWRAFGHRVTLPSFIAVSIVIGLMSVFTAFTETFTIQNFPYYELACRWEMYTYGSVFYGLYFIVSYPMFLRMDERPTERWTFFQAFVEGMAVSMLITTALDFWRLFIGPICAVPAALASATAVPFVPATAPAGSA